MSRTRIVRWLRVLLPLIALVILSTLFLFSRGPEGESSIPYAEVDAEDMARDPRMIAPEYAGVSGNGAAITLRAEELRSGADGEGAGGNAEGLRMTWRAQDGLAADLTAPGADVQNDLISLTGGVRMTTSSGWALTTPQIDSDIATAQIDAPQQVRGFAPFGQFSAGAMQLKQEGDAGDHVLNFTGGVNLIYQP